MRTVNFSNEFPSRIISGNEGDSIYLVDVSPFFYKGDNFCGFLFSFLYINALLKKRSTLIKGKKCSQSRHSFHKGTKSIRQIYMPRGTNLFAFSLDPIFRRAQKQFKRSYLPWQCIHWFHSPKFSTENSHPESLTVFKKT